MIQISAIALTSILLSLSVLHFYWAFGGKLGLSNAVPQVNGEAKLNPGKIATLFVALLFSLAALLVLVRIGGVVIGPNWIPEYGTWLIAIVFGIRAIGDFKYVGFFKRITGSNFSKYDTLFYSPLCILVSLLAVLISVSK